MRYFANPTGSAVEAMKSGLISLINTPSQGGATPENLPPNVQWCADNGCFGKNYIGDDGFLRWLASYNAEQISRCKFAVAPDVVGDAQATLERSSPFLPKIRSLGYPVAFVAQDGLEGTKIPWDDFDALFIGGSTEFKLGIVAKAAVAVAKRRGKWVHMGRVNSMRRLEYATAIGCDSADGTFLIFGPDKNLPQLLGWVRKVNQQTAMFGGQL